MKVCVICGEDCSGCHRTKDSKGRYYHKDCYDQAKQEQEARRAAAHAEVPLPSADEPEAMSLLSEIMDESVDTGPSQSCLSCGYPLAAGAVICTRCGFNVQSGRALKVKVKKEKAPREGSMFGETATALLRSPFVVSMMVLAILATLLVIVYASGSPAAALAFVGFATLFLFTSYIVVLVVAFIEGFVQGLLTLCIPAYVFYFVFFVTDNQWARWFFVVSLMIRGVCLLLFATT